MIIRIYHKETRKNVKNNQSYLQICLLYQYKKASNVDLNYM